MAQESRQNSERFLVPPPQHVVAGCGPIFNLRNSKNLSSQNSFAENGR